MKIISTNMCFKVSRRFRDFEAFDIAVSFNLFQLQR